MAGSAADRFWVDIPLEYSVAASGDGTLRCDLLTEWPPLLPDALAVATRWYERLSEANALPMVPRADLERVLAGSDFVATTLLSDPLFRADPAYQDPHPFAAASLLTDEAALMVELRRARKRALAGIAWRDVLGLTDTQTTLTALSMVADQAIRVAVEFASRSLEARYGTPRDALGVAQALIVVGMGKLGGGELNFSSDVDLVFLYPEDGHTDGERSIDNFDYFTRLGQLLIRLLDAKTADGFVYRVDMRLRPFGDSGPLAASFSSLEGYLQEHGRDWERYAWIKARPITGEQAYADLFHNVIRPFVFRRYLDFGVLASLREMHALISREVARRDLVDHVKLGPGGIREVEFIVQALQLVRGGSDPALRPPSLLTVLPRLAGGKLLPDDVVTDLYASYLYLRRLENCLQMVDDEQIHSLPRDEIRQARIAAMLMMPSFSALVSQQTDVRARVTRYFAQLVFKAENTLPVSVSDFDAALAEAAEATDLHAALAALKIPHVAAIADLLMVLVRSSYYGRLEDAGRRRLTALLPRLLMAAGCLDDCASVLTRAFKVLEAIGSRAAYLSLLTENPLALTRLVDICALGQFLPDQIAAFPLLLDELVDQRLFDELPSRAQFEEEINARVASGADDPERLVEVLREFQRAAVFRVALLELTSRMPLMQVSDRLTDIAELIIERVMSAAWQDMVKLYGVPMAGAANALHACSVAAVGYGKLGGRELGYGSDLDLVFLHDSAGEVQETQGPKIVENGIFFLRLGQKIVHYLTVHTAAGRLYEVDMRLRPSGKGGLLMTYIGAFVDYQQAEAWTWEHQALLHSRAVAGAPALRAQFERDRVALLQNAVRRTTLRDDVRAMRERMRRELSRSGEGEFDIKQDAGGVADIEFLAQYFVLSCADRYPPLLTYSDTIRQLESVGSAALVDHATIDRLIDAYRDYRALTHRLSLEGAKPVVAALPYDSLRASVAAVWASVMGEAK